MKTKEIDGVLYKLVPEKEKFSCEGCVFRGLDRSICNVLTDDCNKGFIYEKADQLVSDFHLKPFNLEEAKAGKPVCTRDGRKARIICFDSTLENYPLVVLVGDYPYPYTAEGKSNKDSESSSDLMMIPERKEGWVVIRKGDIYETEELAEKELLDSQTAMMIGKISWEE